MSAGWSSILLAAVSAYYFGWVQGKKEVTTQAGEIVIGGQKFLVPRNIYDQIQSLINTAK